MNFKNVYILEDRGILFINGPDAKEFLQNLITNDINKVNPTNSCFASLLTPQGKFLFDFLIIQHKNGYFIDCEKKQAEELLKQLNVYKLRSKIEITNLSNEFVIAAFSYEKFMSFKEAKDILGNTFAYNEDPILLDPRHKKLGGRLIINLEKLYLSLKKIDLKSTEPEQYYNYSFNLGIPQKNMDKLRNKLFGIECNFGELNGIDFKKGCYVGQENTSRIKLRNKLRRRILPVKNISGEISDNDIIKYKGVEIGKIMISKPYSFGLIKVVEPDIKEFINNDLDCGNSKVKIIKPEWI